MSREADGPVDFLPPYHVDRDAPRYDAIDYNATSGYMGVAEYRRLGLGSSPLLRLEYNQGPAEWRHNDPERALREHLLRQLDAEINRALLMRGPRVVRISDGSDLT